MKGEIRNVGGTSTNIVNFYSHNVAYPGSAIIRVPTGAGTIYLGHAGVTSSNGFPLAAGESLEVDMVNDALYAVATTTTTINILRRGD